MSKAIVKSNPVEVAMPEEMQTILSNIVLHGDIGKLQPVEKMQYYNTICNRLGIDPTMQPFQIIKLQGKEVMYATKSCTEQLRMIHGVSVTSMETQSIEGVFVVKVSVQNAKGRIDFGTGAVNVKGLSGDALANAFMKAETKAKRRATLSICGLGMLDETEIETIPEASPVPIAPVLAAKIDDVLKNTAPTAPVEEKKLRGAPREPEEKFDARVALTEWREAAKELKSGDLFDAEIKKLLANERVKKIDELGVSRQKTIVSAMAAFVEALRKESAK